MDLNRRNAYRLPGIFGGIVMLLAAFGACDDQQEDVQPEPGIVPDDRAVLELPPEARSQVRSEMRHMLSALNGSISSLARGDLPGVAEAARSGGTAVAVDTDPALAERLPVEFRDLGMDTHRRFDSLAAAADTGAATDSLLQALGKLTANCVACHETYTAVSLPPRD